MYKDMVSIYTIVGKQDRSKTRWLGEPYYHETAVWDVYRQSKLIESMLMGLNLPDFIFVERKDAACQVLDGFQRLNVIRRFLSDEFALGVEDPELKGRKFCDLHPAKQNLLEDYKINLRYILWNTAEEVKADIFDCVNLNRV